ncbi:MAG: hypothetical protein U0270_20415 [Labilithrix sp.]
MSRLARWSLVLLGCSAPAPRASQARPDIEIRLPFPPRSAVEELARTEATPLPRREVATTSSWRVEPAPDASPIESHFSGVTFAKGLRCVAREYGRLRAEKGVGQPDERLERFIAGACGLTAPVVAATSWAMTAPESMRDDAVIAAFAGKMPMPDDMKGKPAGAWITRKDAQAILTLVSGTPDATVRITLADPSGRVTVEGTTDVEGIGALVNRGRDGVAACQHDVTTTRPAFRLTCTLAPTDPWAYIEVFMKARSDALFDSRALVLARRDLTTPLELATPEPEAAAGDPERRILNGVNRARQAAKRGALSLAADQSMTNARLAPHFFRATLDRDVTTKEGIARGLVAGWDVAGGTIRGGQFYGSLLTGARTPESWVDFALETPLGRAALLRPDVAQIAIGVSPSASVGGAGVVVTTYDFYERGDRRADEAVIHRRLNEARAARKLPPITSLPEMPVLGREIDLVRSGKRNPRDVTDVVLSSETRRLQRPLVGAMSIVRDLEHMSFAPVLFAPGPLAVRVAVTSYQPERSPWGVYLVYIIGSVPEE